MTDKNFTDQGVADSARGKANEIKGKVKDAAGGLMGDTRLQAEGKLDQAKGKVQDIIGKGERKLGSHTDEVDDI